MGYLSSEGSGCAVGVRVVLAGVGESVSVCVLVSCKFGVGCEDGVGCEALGVPVLRLLSERVRCTLLLSLGAVILGRGCFCVCFLACLV